MSGTASSLDLISKIYNLADPFDAYDARHEEARRQLDLCGRAEGHLSVTKVKRGPKVRQKNEMRERLRSEEGYELSILRMIEPESVFGQAKNKRGFRRFLLRGLRS